MKKGIKRKREESLKKSSENSKKLKISQSSITILPDEILYVILSQFSLFELMDPAKVSTQWNALVKAIMPTLAKQAIGAYFPHLLKPIAFVEEQDDYVKLFVNEYQRYQKMLAIHKIPMVNVLAVLKGDLVIIDTEKNSDKKAVLTALLVSNGYDLPQMTFNRQEEIQSYYNNTKNILNLARQYVKGNGDVEKTARVDELIRKHDLFAPFANFLIQNKDPHAVLDFKNLHKYR